MNEKADNLPIILEIELVRAGSTGVKAKDLRDGDIVLSLITDTREIGQYLARLLGGQTKDTSVPLPTPIEEIQCNEKEVRLQTRFTPGVVGRTVLNPDIQVKVVKRNRRYIWWYKILKRILPLEND